MRLAGLALIPAAALLVAACSSGGGATTEPSATGASSAPAASAAVTRIEIALTDALTIPLQWSRFPTDYM